MIRGFTVKALITPKVLGVETSLDGFAKFGLFSKLKISHRKISFTRSVRGVLLMAALSRMLKGSPDWSVAIPEMLQPFPSFRMVVPVACSGPGKFHVPLITNR